MMKLSEDTLICLGEILAGKSESHNSEINKLQHDHVRSVLLHDWYFLFSSPLALPLASPPSFAVEEFLGDDPTSLKSNALEIHTLRMEGGDSEPIVAVRLSGTRPVASLIEGWGEPPQVLQKDWRQQLDKLEGPHEILFFLVTDDGLLSKIPGTKRLINENRDVEATHLDATWKQVQWPWERTTDEPSFHQIRNPTQTVKKQRRPKNRPLILAVSAVAGIVLITSFVVMLWPSNRPGASQLAKSTNSSGIDTDGGRRQSDEKAKTEEAQSNSQSNLPTASDSSMIDPDTLEGTDLKKDSLDNTDELLALSSDLTNLLGQETNGEVILSNRIVETSLGTSAPMTFGEAVDTEAAEMPTNSADDDSKPEDESTNPPPLDLEVGMERTIQLTEATIKDRIAIGQKLLSKDGTCTATLHLEQADTKPVAIVAPEGMITIVGNGTNSWTIGMEESEPEIILQLQSKPGRRWDIFVLVGFREEKSQPPRLLAPGNAKSVVNQLIAAKQSVLRMLEQNQLARDSGVRSGTNLYEQRRQLQRQEKELDKALERWKVIEKLSYLIFDQAKLQVTLKRTPSN